MCGSGFDLDGRAAPAVLLHLRHPLTGHLVGVISGAHRDLVLDNPLTFQLLLAVTEKIREVINHEPHELTQVPLAERRLDLRAECKVTGRTLQPATCLKSGTEPVEIPQDQLGSSQQTCKTRITLETNLNTSADEANLQPRCKQFRALLPCQGLF